MAMASVLTVLAAFLGAWFRRVSMHSHAACGHIAQHAYGSQGRWGNYALTWAGNY